MCACHYVLTQISKLKILRIILLVEFRELDIKYLSRFYFYFMEVENRLPTRH